MLPGIVFEKEELRIEFADSLAAPKKDNHDR
jgi:hypothetical protein